MASDNSEFPQHFHGLDTIFVMWKDYDAPSNFLQLSALE